MTTTTYSAYREYLANLLGPHRAEEYLRDANRRGERHAAMIAALHAPYVGSLGPSASADDLATSLLEHLGRGDLDHNQRRELADWINEREQIGLLPLEYVERLERELERISAPKPRPRRYVVRVTETNLYEYVVSAASPEEAEQRAHVMHTEGDAEQHYRDTLNRHVAVKP